MIPKEACTHTFFMKHTHIQQVCSTYLHKILYLLKRRLVEYKKRTVTNVWVISFRPLLATLKQSTRQLSALALCSALTNRCKIVNRN